MYILVEDFMNGTIKIGEHVAGVEASSFSKAKDLVYKGLKIVRRTELIVTEDSNERLCYQIEHGDSGITTVSRMNNVHLEIVKE